MLAMLVQIMPTTLGVSAAATDTIVLYPEYSEKINRDYMYRVYVSQGGERYEIPVYNDMRHANNFSRDVYGTDSEVDRRFCQFSATPSNANPVTVEIVSNISFTKYSIIPSIKNIASTVSGNKISFNITEAGQYVFRLNDNNITNLAIFADAVETDIPNKNADNVVVFDEDNRAPNAIGSNGVVYSSNTVFYVEDWQEVEFFELQSGQQLYIAPGAVLNARVQIMNNQQNIKIFGRGMLRDFNDTRAYNSGSEMLEKRNYCYLLTVGSSWADMTQSANVATNVTIKDILLFDAKGFNLVFQGASDCTVDNMKVVANEISTDGISFWNCQNIEIKNSYLNVSDNVFVVDRSKNVTLDNMLVGSFYSIFFPQSEYLGPHTYKNINVFASNTLFQPAGGFKYSDPATTSVTVENLSAIDCVAPVGGSTSSKMGCFFSTSSSASDSSVTKKITFKNVTLPSDNNSYAVQIGVANAKAGNYNIVLQNVYAGTTALTRNNVRLTDSTTSGQASSVSVSNDGSYTAVKRNTTSASYTAYSTYIRVASTKGRQYYSPTEPYAKNNTTYVSAKKTAEVLGFKTYFDADDMSLTIYDEDVLLRATAGSDKVLYNDKTVTLSAAVEYGDEIMVPIDFFSKTLGITATVSGKNITIGNYDRAENLPENGDFEDKNSLGSWTTLNFARLTRSNVAYRSNTALRFADEAIFSPDALEPYQGVFQDVRETILQNGAGVYELSFWAKSNNTSPNISDTVRYYISGMISTDFQTTDNKPSYATKHALTNDWQKYTQQIVVGESSGTPNLSSSVLYATILIKGGIDVSVDDITLTKISDTTSSSYTLSLGAGNSISYGASKTLTVSGSNTSSLSFAATNDYLKVTNNNGTVTVEVAYPSNYERTARIVAKNTSGTVVGDLIVTIPAAQTAGHVVDFDANLVLKDSYKVGETVDTTGLKLTNVLYNDGTTATVTAGYDLNADFSTAGEKTVTLTYDNKSITYTTTVVEGQKTNAAGLKTLGANIRFANDELSAGLRFAATFEKNDLYDTYYPTTDADKEYVYADSNNYQFGAIMVPTSLIPDGENVVSMYQSGSNLVLEALGKRVYAQNSKTLTFTGVLVGIPETVKDYSNVIQTAFYVRVRESETDDWTYYFSTSLEDSYYSVAVKAAEKTYNYTNMPNPTENQRKIIETLEDIIGFVEDENWVGGDWW